VSDQVPGRALQLRSLVTESQMVELSLEDVDVPAPGPGQVVVRVEAAPINPSDLGLMLAGADVTQATSAGTADHPVVTAPLPAAAARAAAARVGQSLPAGNEGAGTVVAAGASDAAQALLGKVVAVAGGAMYTQYRCVAAAACLELPEGARAADGAASFVNPMTVLGMVETMRMEGHTGLVHTAAASNLGQMLNRLCIEEQIPLVNIVRSPAQAELLAAAGATWVCDSTAGTFMNHLVEALGATKATLAFDAVGGGTLASRILTGMEAALSAGAEFSRYGSSVHKQVYIYGGLDRGPTELTRGFGMAWGVGGWLLTPFLQKAGPQKMAAMRQRVAAGLTTTFASHFTDEVSLAGALRPEAIAVYGRAATGQKYLIRPAG
jgi:NADPH:quinone reductase